MDSIVDVSLINVDLQCSESGSPCSPGSVCLEGELGVYCQCYERYSTSEEVSEIVAVAQGRGVRDKYLVRLYIALLFAS